ncbi:MAG: hypothetical protein DRJ97_04345 [Thermoprotei archaeon]|nr:MAG: hypothetical protein DRJ97_04345 [Thermoprotei archaeon]
MSFKVIDSELPLASNEELTEILRAFYEAERAKASRRLKAYRARRAQTCKHSSAIQNRYDCFCSKCLADELLIETIWCELLQREVCPRCDCESCERYEHWRGEGDRRAHLNPN